MEYSYTDSDMWNNNYNYTIIDGTSSFASSAYTQEEHYVQDVQYIQDAQKEYYIQTAQKECYQNDFWKKYFNGDFENKDDRLVEILKMLLEEYESPYKILLHEKVNLIKEALEIADNKSVYDFKPIEQKDEKPSYLDDDLFEI